MRTYTWFTRMVIERLIACLVSALIMGAIIYFAATTITRLTHG